MPTDKTQLNIFIACPNDLLPEAKIIKQVVDEINLTISQTSNYLFKVNNWETSTFPDFGSYPQNVINKQIFNDMDILIVLFWSRIGSATPNFKSGTVEELELALINKTNYNKPQVISVYFKNTAIEIDKLDPNQLAELLKYKKSLASRGFLFGEYDNISDFENKIRTHLSLILPAFSKSTSINLEIQDSILLQTSASPIITEDDLGFFDYVQSQVEATALVTKTTNYFGVTLNQMSKKTNGITLEIDRVNHLNTKDIGLIRTTINKQANNWNLFLEKNSKTISTYETSMHKSQNSLQKMILYLEGFGKNESNYKQIQSILRICETLKSSVNQSLPSILKLQESVSRINDLTKEIKSSKRQLTYFLSEWTRVSKKAIGLISQNESECRRILDSW